MSNPLCEPQIMTIQEGVLARTPSEHAFPIGVVGRDEAEARQRFNEALERWEKWATLTEQRLQAVRGRPFVSLGSIGHPAHRRQTRQVKETGNG